LTGKQASDSLVKNASVNAGVLFIPFLLAIFYPNVGSLASILGSLAGFGCIYMLPTLTWLKHKKTEVRNPILA
jgi:hypothetical protein